MQVLLADDLFVDMAGVFEYDSELKEKGEHRKFLTEKASFKQVAEASEETQLPWPRLFFCFRLLLLS